MNLQKNTILVTGGSNGIGLAFAERFLAADNTVIICGRNEQKLRAAKTRHPALHIKACDLADSKFASSGDDVLFMFFLGFRHSCRIASTRGYSWLNRFAAFRRKT